MIPWPDYGTLGLDARIAEPVRAEVKVASIPLQHVGRA